MAMVMGVRPLGHRPTDSMEVNKQVGDSTYNCHCQLKHSKLALKFLFSSQLGKQIKAITHRLFSIGGHVGEGKVIITSINAVAYGWCAVLQPV
jgi:hypothetical protein